MADAAIKKIGILTGGGDCPGLNAVIRAAVKTAIIQYGWKVIGIKDGFEGLLKEGKTRPLLYDYVKGILSRGGTILGSSNRGNPFEYKFWEGGKIVTEDRSSVLMDNLRSQEDRCPGRYRRRRDALDCAATFKNGGPRCRRAENN